jgi:DNA-binding transcriptional MerR regulator
MKAKPLFMSRQEVADYFGVDRQTISNWTSRGLITPVDHTRGHHYSREQIEAYASSLINIHRHDTRIAELEHLLQEKRYALEVKWSDIETEEPLKPWDVKEAFVRVANGIIATLPHIASRNDERVVNIVNDLLRFTSRESIAEKYELSCWRIQQLFNRALRWYAEAPNVLEEKDKRIAEQIMLIAELKGKCAQLANELATRKEQQEEPPIAVDEDFLAYIEKCETPMDSFPLSVRVKTCLAYAEIETLGELIALEKHDLLKFRNFGRKSLTEIEDLLESLNLHFGDTRYMNYKTSLKQ